MSSSVSESGQWPSDLMRGLTVQRRVIVALSIRQLMTKYGRSNIGFLWIVLEPMILCSGVLVVRSFISGGHENGIPLIAMLWSGYMPLTLWRHLSSAGVNSIRRSAGMLYHRDISIFDCFLSTFVIETGGCTMAAFIVYWVLYTFDLIGAPDDMALLLGGWCLMAWIALSAMVGFAVLTQIWEPAERFVQPFQYLFLPLCGFFFMVSWLPTYAQKYAWWVPTVHCYEMIRAGLLSKAEVETHYTWWYPVLFGLVQFAIMLPLIETARKKVHFG